MLSLARALATSASATILLAAAAAASPAEPPAPLVLAQAQTPAGAPAEAPGFGAQDEGGPDWSDVATPEAFRFPGAMASIWSKSAVEGLAADQARTIPLMIHERGWFEEGIYVWDAWPMRTPDGAVATIDGWVVMVGLSAEAAEMEATGREFFTLSTWRYWFTRDGEWRPGGVVFTREEGLGSRQWAGSTFFDPNTGQATFYYTAVGRPDAESLEDDRPTRPVSIHNEAAGRPNVEQRLASVSASVIAGPDGVAFRDFGEHRIIGEADGFWYDTIETYLAGEAVYGFRDPEFMVDPITGREHVLFTANAAGVPGPYNGAVGMLTREDDGGWRLEPPILVSMGVNSQLERPHVVYREGAAYLFFSTHDFTFASDAPGPRGLYGFRSESGRLRDRWVPLNGDGLVAANPPDGAAQVYSFLVLPDGHVMSYLNETYGFELDPENEEREFVGAPGPMFRIEMFGEEAFVVGADDGR